jgi:predicted metal-dependent HD superfamily phosphohydrolase
MQRLISAYQEPHRKYHTIQHLSECIGLLERNLDLAIEPAEIEIALWFHDAIYDVKVIDNEEKSADLAESELLKASVALERALRVKSHILATKHPAIPKGQDQQLLVDIDLSILGAPLPRFEEYEGQVRAEYAWVPEQLFSSMRREILEGFLACKPIFNTERLRESLENRARNNLARSISYLEKIE